MGPPSQATAANEPIAVIGSGCRFPGSASSPSKLWQLLSQPRDVLSEIPKSRFDPHGFYNKNGETGGHSNVLHSYVLDEDIRAWDADFFKVSASEAAAIDPQQRLLMETVYEALEAGGQQIHALRGSDTAVYVGLMGEEYSDIQGRELDMMPTYHATGTARSIVSNRISYFFDWHGASMTIDTACSSSLVAVHQCVQAIRSGYSRVAVAAGTNLCLGPEPYISESTFHMLSPRGRSHMWDASADGYGRGEGVAAVILKKLSDAIADGDHIECVIRETGVNQDGRTNGITVPSPDAQVALIQDTYRRAGLDLARPEDQPQFFEAHGTGTGAGDPLEAEAIYRAIGTRMAEGKRLYVGSIKTIIGHTEGTAGIAGLMKASLALQNRTIPPNMLFNTLNPKIEPFIKKLQIPQEPRDWPDVPVKRASVNSFGFGGTNAHAILERYEPDAYRQAEGGDAAFAGPYTFSAVSKTSLKQMLVNTLEFLDDNPAVKPRDLAYTLNSRRSTFTFRTSFAGRDVDALRKRITASIESPDWESQAVIRPAKQPLKILGIFTGQGAQWPGMGKQLLDSSPSAQARIQELELALATLQPGDRPCWSLKAELLAEGSKSRLSQAEFAQPLCTALQILLIDLLTAAGVQFSAVVGHSSGEIGAAYAAGVLSARDAIVVAYYRGVHTKLARGDGDQPGAMLAAGTTFEDAQDLVSLPELEGRIAIAACNSPSSVTLSGDADAIEAAVEMLSDEQKFARTLRVDKAYHSHHMRPCSEPYVNSLRRAGVAARDPRPETKWFSSVHAGRVLTSAAAEQLSDTYWALNMAQTVLFSAAVEEAVASEQYTAAIEVGPHGTLKGPAIDTIKAAGRPVPTYLSCLARNMDSLDTFSTAIGQLWATSPEGSLDLERYSITAFGPSQGANSPLKGFPSYPWDNKRRFWSESRRSRAFRLRPEPGHPLLGTLGADSTATDWSWHNVLRLTSLPWVNGHQLQGQTVWPAAGYVALAVEAANQLAKGHGGLSHIIELEDLDIGKAIAFENDKAGVELLFSLHVNNITVVNGQKVLEAGFSSRSSVGEASTEAALNASGHIRLTITDFESPEPSPALPVQDSARIAMTEVDQNLFYNELKVLGYNYTGPFRALHSLSRKLDHGRGRLARVSKSDMHDSERGLLVHPGYLDAAFQAMFLAYAYPGDGQIWSLHVPVSIGRIRIDATQSRANADSYLTFDSATNAVSQNNGQRGLAGDVNIFSADGQTGLVQVENIRLIPFAAASEANDAQVYYHNVWNTATPDGLLASEAFKAGEGVAQEGLGQAAGILAHVVGQITHINPHARLLQIGDESHEVAQRVLGKIGGAFSHYTLTSPSPDAVEEARDALHAKSRHLGFMELRPNEDFVAQGLREQSFEVAISALAAHTVQDAEAYIKKIHQVLRPGGYLLMLEPTLDSLRGSLSGKGKGTRGIPTAEWHSLLLRAGFTGVETSASDSDRSGPPFNVLVSRAANDHVNLLLEPSTIPSPEARAEHTLIVSGRSLASVRLAETMRRLLTPHTDRISVVSTVGDLTSLDLSVRPVVLYLADLDEPVFSHYTAEAHAGLQALWTTAQTVLWTTRGAQKHDPHSLQSIGFGRAMAVEHAHAKLNAQFFDFAPGARVDPHALLDDLLRLQILGKRSSNTQGDFVWTKEPEIQVDELGRRWIPRLVPHSDFNNGYNAARRSIVADADPSRHVVEVVSSRNSDGSLQRSLLRLTVPRTANVDSQEPLTKLRVLYTAETPFHPPSSAQLYASIGLDVTTSKPFVALSSTISSIIEVPTSSLIEYNHRLAEGPAHLHGITTSMLASLIIRTAKQDAATVLLEPSRELVSLLSKDAAAQDLKLAFVTASPATPKSESIHLGAYSTDSAIRRALSFNIASVLDFTNRGSWSERILKQLAPDVIVESADSFRAHGLAPAEIIEAFRSFIDAAPIAVQDHELVSADDFVASQRSSPSILDWAGSSTVSVSVQTPDSQPIFRGDRTYILFGLAGAGGLGLPLAEYMASLGARYIVLTSRNPEVDQDLVAEYASRGVHLRFMANDITNENQVSNLVSEIRASWPPIAGVANGANVLNDMQFKDMTHDDMVKVLRPKVEGSKTLDRLFFDDPLEFFIGFSSISIVFGRSGQSNYDAANIFMLGLASQRRARGLNASVIDIGPISGVGLMARDVSENVMGLLVNHGYRKMSGRDFLQLFLNGITCGRVESGEPEELITGLTVHPKNGDFKPTWTDNARFSHLFLNTDDSSGSSADGTGQMESIQDLLLRSSTKNDVARVLRHAILNKMQNVLSLSDESVLDSESLLQRDTSSLGLDSLLAVELRTWMLGELEVDLPVLKILSDTPIQGLVDFAVDNLPPALAPSVTPEGKDSITEEDLTAPKAKTDAPAAAPTPASATAPGSKSDGNVSSIARSADQSPSHKDTLPQPTAILTNATAGTKPVSPSLSVTGSTSSAAGDDETPTSSQAASLESSQVIDSRPVIDYKPVIEKTLPMSYGQSRFWVMNQIVQDPTAFNITCDIEISSEVDKAVLSRAVDIIGARHEALRTCFLNDENHEPIQAVMNTSTLRLEVVSDDQSQVDSYFEQVKKTVYDLSNGYLMRALLVSTSKTSHHLIVGYHHVNMDSTSFVVFMSDLLKIYAGQTLSPPKVQYPDFAQYQLQRLRNGQWASHINYWTREFAKLPDPLPLLSISPKASRPRPYLTNYQNIDAETRVSATVARQIQSTSRRLKVTPFHVYTTVLQIVLARLSGTDDVCIGMADANRTDIGAIDSIGNFLNLLPLRLTTDAKQSFETLVKVTKNKILHALSHSAVPFDVILEKVGVQRSPTHSPLFQAFIDYRHVTEKLPFGTGFLEGKRYAVSETPYDIMVEMIDTPTGEASLKILVQEALYTSEDAQTIMDCYINLLDAVTKDDRQAVGKPQIFNSSKVQKALELGQGETLNLQHATILPELDDIAAVQPTLTALQDSIGGSLSWSEMKAKSIAIGRNLDQLRLAPQSRVGVFQAPEVDWVCSMLGVWRSGHIYVPLETTQGIKRLSDVAQQARLDAILLHDPTVSLFSQLSLPNPLPTINVSAVPFAHLTDQRHFSTLKPDDQAMIVYTSGSTGVPKGITIAHRVVVNAVRSFLHRWPMTPQTVLQQTALSFDVSWWATVVGLATKGSVVVAGSDSRRDPRALTDLIVSKDITFTFAVPSESVSWLESGNADALRASSWAYHCSGGEPYSLNLIDKLKTLNKPDLTAINIYGPTETMIPNAHVVEYRTLTADDLPVPIGTTMPNYLARVVDLEGHPVPAGVPGELIFVGPGIASGYVDNAALTAERFPKDSLAGPEYVKNGWDVAHNSGDHGYLDGKTGEFVLQARIKGDTQVKLRGLRIDMQDVEANILTASNRQITDAIVHVRKPELNNPSADFLLAHVVLSREARLRYPTPADQSAFFRDIVRDLRVPDYMRPALVVALDSLPLTHHGKADRRAIANLPLDQIASQLQKEPVPLTNKGGLKETPVARPTRYQNDPIPRQVLSSSPFSSLDQVKDLWLDILGTAVNAHTLDPESDFFLVGGNSLLLIRIQGELRKRAGLDVPLTQLFQNSTLGQMASLLDGKDRAKQQGASGIDWVSEIKIQPNLARLRANRAPLPQDGLVMALTGATGFLGLELTRRLIDLPNVRTVHALSVRDSRKLSQLQSPKLVVHSGDLSRPSLGMDSGVLAQIFKTSHVVIHNGADVSFLKSYGSVRATNLESTKEIAKLALQHNNVRALHYVSTAGIATMLSHDLYEESIGSFPPSSSPEGYVLTKWAAELYLERVAAVTNLPVTIHRPTAIVGENAPHLDVMSNILHYSQKLNTVPSMTALEGTFQFVPVEDVANGLVGRVVAGHSSTLSAVEYQNHNGAIEDTVDVHGLAPYLSNKHGRSVTVTPDAEWIALASRAGMADEVVQYMGGVNMSDRKGEKWRFPRALNGSKP
uniref:Hybrid PKS-NRPS synthetase ucsA n=1 Tax=Acremonium sp. TaxID=2046025 RepID=UCSA_ACRSP|nr:RecName: Full=Hybrid PKS-NRPS synthetase ucsA; AltName: Full=UCS1025A pyrrolizidinone biosynthesis cluster protein A [Acremonium sp.]QBC88145.1 UcsA [Acremonium sp.]